MRSFLNPFGWRSRRRRARADAGFTLPELVITVMVVGVVMATLSSVVVVVARQETASDGRLNNARSEQTLGMWMPADLASASSVDVAASASPCGTQCPSTSATEGSNMVMLSWQTMLAPGAPPTMQTTNVSYRYVQGADSWKMVRVQCDRPTAGNWSCTDKVVSHNIAAPPAGTSFVAGQTYPSWAVNVSRPLDPIDPGTGTTVPADESLAKNATRVTLTVHGGSTHSGSSGGLKNVAITAGSTKIVGDLDVGNMDGAPSFGAMRSRCGGNFGLIVDSSGSIGSSMSSIRTGLTTFVNSFQGTPMKIQLVDFDSYGRIVGGANNGKDPRWYDMLVESDVTALKNGINGISAAGGTNWEEGFYRMFRDNSGAQQAILPDTVLFFTDGAPTFERLVANSASGPLNPPADQGFPDSNGSAYSQEAFFRASYIAALYRDITTKFIGVGVGPVVDTTMPWRIKQADGKQTTVSTPAMTVIARLVSGTDTAIPAVTDQSGSFTNAATATLYKLPEWSKFAAALEAVALSKCGGTLTVQTIQDGATFPYPVSYQNTAAKLPNGSPANISLATVTTSMSYPSGTFDYAISTGGYLTVDIMPASLADLDGFAPVGWSCKSRGVARAFTPLPIAGSAFTGIRVQVNVNEALSCKLTIQAA